jgi:gas vesicle structural protein
MALQQGQSALSILDVLDRILDKGIVIDAWARISLNGIELVTVEGRILVASFQTYLNEAPFIGPTALASPPGTRRTALPAPRARRGA